MAWDKFYITLAAGGQRKVDIRQHDLNLCSGNQLSSKIRVRHNRNLGFSKSLSHLKIHYSCLIPVVSICWSLILCYQLVKNRIGSTGMEKSHFRFIGCLDVRSCLARVTKSPIFLKSSQKQLQSQKVPNHIHESSIWKSKISRFKLNMKVQNICIKPLLKNMHNNHVL